MGEDRLIGSTLLHIHRDIQLDLETIIEKFSKKIKVNFIL